MGDYSNITMKFAFATALLAFSQVQATEVSTEAEWGGYGGYGRSSYSTIGRVVRSYSPAYHYNGHGHHSYSSHSSSDDSSYYTSDYSSSGYGYRSYSGRHRYYRYKPRYSSGRYYYGRNYASYSGHYRGSYRSLGYRSCNACYGGCSRPTSYAKW